MNFPRFPQSNEEIRVFPGPGEYMACAIVHRAGDMRQLMAYKKLRQKMGEMRFREVLVEGLDILSRSNAIHSPAGWLYDFIASEANAAQA